MTLTAIAQATGNIEVEGDNDWFKVSLNAGTEYSFNIAGGTLGSNGTLAVYDSTGKVVSSVVSGTQILFEPTASGTYYIGAAGSGVATGSYTITEFASTFDFAGNTTTTGTIAVGSTASGALTTPGHADWFKVSLTAGTSYALNIASGTLGSAQVALYDANGNLVSSGNSGNTINGTNAFYTPTTSGTYYVAASDTQSGLGAFTVSVNTASVGYAGNIDTTGTVSAGGHVTGTIGNVGQSEWFKVTLTAGSQYVFDLSGSNGLYPAVTVYDASGNAVSPTSFTGGSSGGALVTFEPTTTGTYYVGAASNFSTVGTFDLAVSTATPDFLGTIHTTGTLTIGGHVSGSIATQTQSDWFKVTLTAGAAYNISIGNGTLSSASLAVYDSTGKALTTGAAQTLFEPTASGTYYIGAAGSGTGTFTLSLASATVDHLGTTATTATIAAGHALTGTLANAGQSDWYKITLTAGTQYVFTETGGTLSTPLASIYDSSGNQVAVSADGGNNGVSSIAFSPAATGTYYVSASSLGSITGSYTLAVSTTTDDHTDSTSTTGAFSTVLSATGAIAANAAGTLGTGTTVVDVASNIQTNLDGLQALVAAGKVTGISLLDSTTPTITVTAAQIASDSATLKDISSPFTLKVSGSSSAVAAFVQKENFNYIPGTNHSGSDQVTEIASVKAGATALALGSGFNVVIVDGTHSTTASTSGTDSFSFNVQSDGTITLHDNNTGQNQSVTGGTYLLFNGAGTNSDGSYQSLFYVGGSVDAQVTSLYQAAFLRQPDLGGLEFYAKPIVAGTFDLHQAAVYFLASPEFATDYPTASLPSDKGGANDQAFINTLYNNVLHRTAAAAEVSFYANALASGSFDRANLLEFFALSPENQANISSFVVNTTNGAYADSSALLSASTVLSEVSSSSALNLAAIAPTSIGTGVSSNGISIAANDAVTLTSSAPTETVFLSPTFSTITVQNTGSTIFDAAGGSTITLSGASNTTLTLTGGSPDSVYLTGGTGTTVNNFGPGGGTILHVTTATDASSLQIMNGSTTQVAGSALTFGAGTSYVVNIGTVADHTAETLATAANKAYAATGATNEAITFIAQDASGNTVVWGWTASGGADTNHNHLVDAAELVNIVTIAGVGPGALSASDLA